jgi:hypothetical protein
MTYPQDPQKRKTDGLSKNSMQYVVYQRCRRQVFLGKSLEERPTNRIELAESLHATRTFAALRRRVKRCGFAQAGFIGMRKR